MGAHNNQFPYASKMFISKLALKVFSISQMPRKLLSDTIKSTYHIVPNMEDMCPQLNDTLNLFLPARLAKLSAMNSVENYSKSENPAVYQRMK